MSKYSPLGEFLRAQELSEVPMTFAEIESVIGVPLPPRAQNHPAWWSNSTTNNTMTKVWLDAGFRSERVDVASRRLVFRRSSEEFRQDGSVAEQPGPAFEHQMGFLERIRHHLAGTVTVAPGVDLTAPTGEVWDAERD